MKYKWLLFDADGTLFDYDRAEFTALTRALERVGLAFEPGHIEVYRHINAGIWQDFEAGRITQDRLKSRRFELLFEALDVTADPHLFSERYLHHLSECSDLIDGAGEVVQQLSGRAGLIMITNGLKAVQRPRFGRSPILDHFTDVMISEEIGSAKPDGAIFDEAFRRMGGPPKSEVMIIGDSLTSDIKGGLDYGIDTCWFNPLRKDRDPDVPCRYEIARLNELLSIVEESR